MILKELATLDSYGQDPELNIRASNLVIKIYSVLLFSNFKTTPGVEQSEKEQNSWTGSIEKTELIDAKKKESSCWG